MKRFAMLILAFLFCLSGAPLAEAVKISISVPSEGSRIFAPTRDFYVVVSLDREGRNPEVEPFNLRFELFRDGNTTAVRTVESAVDASGITPYSCIKTDYAGGWTPDDYGDIMTSPLPDLVYDPSIAGSFSDPRQKAVVTTHYGAALIQGGRTRNFDSTYPYARDLSEGSYTLRVTAFNGDKTEIDSKTVPITFGSVPDKIMSRFSPASHMEKVRAFATEKNSHIYVDPFPGYWDASTLPHGAVPGSLFYEIVNRWRPNDALEYLNGTVRGIVYNISDTSSSQLVEIGSMANALRLGTDSVLWYHYDIGDPRVYYDPGNGKPEFRDGSIVSFPSGEKLVLTRAEIRGDGVSDPVPSDGISYPELADKQVDWNFADGVYVRPRQLLSVFGVVTPMQPDPWDIEASADGTYILKNRVAKVRYSLLDGNREVLSFDAKNVALTRYGINAKPSIYEFRHDIPVPASFDRALTVSLSGFDSYDRPVAGTEKSFILRFNSPSKGGSGGGGCVVGLAPLGMLLLAPLAFAVCDDRRRRR